MFYVSDCEYIPISVTARNEVGNIWGQFDIMIDDSHLFGADILRNFRGILTENFTVVLLL